MCLDLARAAALFNFDQDSDKLALREHAFVLNANNPHERLRVDFVHNERHRRSPHTRSNSTKRENKTIITAKERNQQQEQLYKRNTYKNTGNEVDLSKTTGTGGINPSFTSCGSSTYHCYGK